MTTFKCHLCAGVITDMQITEDKELAISKHYEGIHNQVLITLRLTLEQIKDLQDSVKTVLSDYVEEPRLRKLLWIIEQSVNTE